MKNTNEIKKLVIELSNELDMSDGELLDLCLDMMSYKSYERVLQKLEEWEQTDEYIKQIEEEMEGTKNV